MAKSNAKPVIAQRLIVGILGTTACALLYIIRTNLSVAIVAMVKKDINIDDDIQNDTNQFCYDEPRNKTNNEYDYKVSQIIKHGNCCYVTIILGRICME